MSLRCLLNERCLSDVSSTSYASHVYLSDTSETSPLRCLLNELCLSCVSSTRYMSLRCLPYASSKNFRVMKCLILGMRATCIYIYIYCCPPYPPSPQPLCHVLGIPAGAFSAKMVSLEIFAMYFVKFDVFDQYLNNILINVCPVGECPSLYVS
jgi:hypothetical protein